MPPVMIDEALVLGTQEYLIVDITDKLGNITSLSPTHYDWRIKNDTQWVVQGATATVIGMRAYCLIDTTQALESGEYELFVYFTNAPETPRLGPIRFKIDA